MFKFRVRFVVQGSRFGSFRCEVLGSWFSVWRQKRDPFRRKRVELHPNLNTNRAARRQKRELQGGRLLLPPRLGILNLPSLAVAAKLEAPGARFNPLLAAADLADVARLAAA